jgi:hypothetical protein
MSLIPLPPVSATEGVGAAGAAALALGSSSIRGFGASGGNGPGGEFLGLISWILYQLNIPGFDIVD